VRAAVWHGPDLSQTVEEVEQRALGPHEVLARISAANACVTDVIDSKPRAWPAKAPQIRGHGAVGIVEAVGAGVDVTKPGDRVILSATSYCGACRFCLNGRPGQCVSIGARIPDPRSKLADGREVYCDANIGAFAERAIVDANQVVPIRAEAPDEALAFLSIAGAAGVGAALITAPVERGSTIAVFGCGATGLSYLLGATLAGAERIIAVDPLPHRRELALKIGATDAVDPSAAAPAEQFRELTPDLGGFQGWGADFVYEASANPEAIEQAYGVTRSGGHLVLASVPWDFSAKASLPAIWMGAGGKTIHSSQHGDISIYRDFQRFAGWMDKGLLDFGPLITGRYGLDEINRCFADMESYRTVGAIVEPRRQG
jgi:S-(hydroxymethyl)glutathione dehydrogenase/alcohol dehydrogenase